MMMRNEEKVVLGIRDVVRVGLLLAWDHHQDKDDEAETQVLATLVDDVKEEFLKTCEGDIVDMESLPKR